MPRPVGAVILMLLGAGILAVAWQGYRKGVLPAGNSGLRAYRPTRIDNPLAFHFFLTLYLCSGLALCTWSVLSFFGAAPALQLS